MVIVDSVGQAMAIAWDRTRSGITPIVSSKSPPALKSASFDCLATVHNLPSIEASEQRGLGMYAASMYGQDEQRDMPDGVKCVLKGCAASQLI